jgi:hypothetical protein
MLQIKVNNTPLKSYPITQDENGPYHKGLKGLVQMGGGMQYALDFGNMKAGYKVTANQDCKVITRGSNYGNYIAVDFGSYQVCFVHVYKHGSGTIKAGQPICQVAPTKYNGGYAVHLHVYGKKKYKDYRVRNLIFAQIKNPYKVGEWVELTSDTNLRREPAGHKGALGKKGDKFKIVNGPVEKNMAGKSYTWYQGVNTKLDVYWFFDGNLKKTKKTVDDKCEKRVQRLEKKSLKLAKAIEACEGSNDELTRKISKLENDKQNALEMYSKKNKQLKKVKKQLDECKEKQEKIGTGKVEKYFSKLSTIEQLRILSDNLLNKFKKDNSESVHDTSR